MYEYCTEVIEIPTKLLSQPLTEKEFSGLNDLINQRAAEGWELVTYTALYGGNMIKVAPRVVSTFKRTKMN